MIRDKAKRKSSMDAFRAAHPLYFVFAKRREYAMNRDKINGRNKKRNKEINRKTLVSAANRAQRWTVSDIQFVENHPELTSEKLAIFLKRSWAGVHSLRQRMGLKTPRERIFRVLELEYHI